MKNKEILYLITKWVELNQKTISHYFLFKHYSGKIFVYQMTSQWRGGEGGIGVVKSRATHGGGPISPQNRIFSANVVLFRRTHKSSGREREGG